MFVHTTHSNEHLFYFIFRMRSDQIIRSDPRAKVITDPSGANKLLEPVQSKPTPTGPRRGGRGGGRPRGARMLSDRMDLD
jgi:hypothetical protein